jgi:hypothetical protein
MPWSVNEEESRHLEFEVELIQQSSTNLFYCAAGKQACANPLCDLPRFTLRYSRAPQFVKQRGLAVINMPQYHDDWLAKRQPPFTSLVQFLGP